ncbi:MAG: metallophosphoesterase [Elusimicrobia bacterium]|nr:metallophosphoesterase [Elusimicrobiota bacterium]
MKILAVSDVQSQSLENVLENTPEKYSDIDCIISCGDLEADYLDFIVDRLGLRLFFVSGNHVFRDETISPDARDELWKSSQAFRQNPRPRIAGNDDIHGRAETFKDFIIVGFGGSMWYNGQENQFTEKQMQNIVNSVKSKINFIRLKDFILRRKRKDIIAISHAPAACIHDLNDLCHKGFECFKNFIKKYSPIVWLHGHVHPDGGNGKVQTSKLDGTTIVNVYGCKIIEIEGNKVSVKSHC